MMQTTGFQSSASCHRMIEAAKTNDTIDFKEGQMTGFKSRRRFIAGAVCPRCSEMDKIVVDLDSDERECVACGFSEGRPQAPAPEEVKTRVSRASARRVETPAQVVRLVDPGSSAASDADE